MKNNRIFYYLFLLITGTVLIALGFAGKLDEFWSGMGSALAIVGAVRLLRSYRLRKSASYREWVETETNDERNQFLRSKAWAWAGYLFILLTGVSVIYFKLVGQDLLSQAASWGGCLMLVLYSGAYLVLKKKY